MESEGVHALGQAVRPLAGADPAARRHAQPDRDAPDVTRSGRSAAACQLSWLLSSGFSELTLERPRPPAAARRRGGGSGGNHCVDLLVRLGTGECLQQRLDERRPGRRAAAAGRRRRAGRPRAAQVARQDRRPSRPAPAAGIEPMRRRLGGALAEVQFPLARPSSSPSGAAAAAIAAAASPSLDSGPAAGPGESPVRAGATGVGSCTPASARAARFTSRA